MTVRTRWQATRTQAQSSAARMRCRKGVLKHPLALVVVVILLLFFICYTKQLSDVVEMKAASSLSPRAIELHTWAMANINA